MNSPDPPSKHFPGALNSFLLLLNLIGLFALARFLPFVTRSFARLFGSAPTGLPQLTQMVLEIPLALYYLIFSGLALILILKTFQNQNQQKITLLNLSAFLGMGLFLVLYTLFLYLPMFTMVTGIS